MKKKLGIATAALLIAGCGSWGTDASVTDLNEPTFSGDVDDFNVTSRAPDEVTIFLNADRHPNIVRICIDGLAFRTISASHAGGLDGSVARVEEWDALCGG